MTENTAPFSEYDFSKTDVKKLLEGYTWLHLSGITPALGKSCSELILTCLKTAKANGMTVSFDGNFQKYIVELGGSERFLYPLPSIRRCSLWN